MGKKVTWVGRSRSVERGSEWGRWRGVTRVRTQSSGVERSGWCCWSTRTTLRTAVWAAFCRRTRCGWGLLARGMSWGVNKLTRFVAQKVFWDVKMRPERWIDGAGVQGALWAVTTARAGGKWTTGLPLGGGGGGAVGATQYGKDTVLALGLAGHDCDGRWAGRFNSAPLSVYLLLLYLQKWLFCRDKQRETRSAYSQNEEAKCSCTWLVSKP